jgi:predicted MFS family arabinose efflux permease
LNNRVLKQMILLLGFMLFLIQGDSYATSPLLIKIAEDFNISISQAGLTAVCYMIPFGFFTIIFGPLGDKYGKMKLISIAAFGTSVFSVLGGFAPSLLILCIFRAMNGMFAAAIMPVSMALIGEESADNPNQLHSSLSKTMALMFFGGAVAPVIGGALSYFGSWRMVYFLYGIFELLLSIMIIIFIRVQSKTNRELTIRKVYKEAFANKQLVKTVSIMSLLGITVLGSFTYMGKFIENTTGFTVFQVGLVLSFYGIGTLFGGRVGPKIMEKLKSLYFIAASFLGSISLLLLATISNFYIIAISLFAFGMAFMLIQPKLVALAQNSFPKNRGTVMSMASFNMAFGGGLGTLLYGIILKQYGFVSIYLIGSVLFLFIAFFASRLSSKKKILIS